MHEKQAIINRAFSDLRSKAASAMLEERSEYGLEAARLYMLEGAHNLLAPLDQLHRMEECDDRPTHMGAMPIERAAAQTISGLVSQILQLDYSYPFAFDQVSKLGQEIVETACAARDARREKELGSLEILAVNPVFIDAIAALQRRAS